MRECPRAGPVMEAFRKPALKSFMFSQTYLACEKMDILSDMLGRFRGLETLRIGFAEPLDETSLLTNVIVKHRETLKSFGFDYSYFQLSSEDEVNSNNDDLINAAGQCKTMAQLAYFCFRTPLLPSIKVLSILKTTNFVPYDYS